MPLTLQRSPSVPGSEKRLSARRDLRSRAVGSPVYSLEENCSGICEQLIFALKPESQTRSYIIRPHISPAGSRSCAMIASF